MVIEGPPVGGDEDDEEDDGEEELVHASPIPGASAADLAADRETMRADLAKRVPAAARKTPKGREVRVVKDCKAQRRKPPGSR